MSKKKALSTGDKTVLALSARGDCYHPNCKSPLVTQRDGRPIVQFEIAHIRDELPPKDRSADIGWRYWPEADMDQTQRNHFNNLLLLCKPCHTLVDKLDPRSYPPELLHQWKSENEGMRGVALAESLGTINSSSLNELIVDALMSIEAISNTPTKIRRLEIRADTMLEEIRRYRSLIDNLLLGDDWVTKGNDGLVVGLSTMAHQTTFEIIADSSMPGYVRQAAIDARNMAQKGRHHSSANIWASYLQRDLKWEANRIRQSLAEGLDLADIEEPSFNERNEPYQSAIEILDK